MEASDEDDDEGRDDFIVLIDDTEAMAQCMEYLLSDPQRCEEMGWVGRGKVRVINDSARVATKHVELYREIINFQRGT